MAMHPALGLPIAYVLGSIPSAYMAGKFKGVDLRQHGSGNLGATNVVRVLGAKIGITVFLIDLIKGLIPVVFLPKLLPAGLTAHTVSLWAMAFGVAAIF